MQQILDGEHPNTKHHTADFRRLSQARAQVGPQDLAKALERFSTHEGSGCTSLARSRQAVTQQNSNVVEWVCLARLLSAQGNWHDGLAALGGADVAANFMAQGHASPAIVCRFACMYICIYAFMYIRTYVSIYVCMHVRT